MRGLSLILSFYLTLAIVQIPFVQSLMPDYVRNFVSPAGNTGYYYLSIVTPEENFNPTDEEYEQGLTPMERDEIEQILANIPSIQKVDTDTYVYKGETADIDIFLLTGDSGDLINEIEFDLPANRLEAIPEVVEIMSIVASNIPNSQIFDFSNETLYKFEDKDQLIRFYTEMLTEARALAPAVGEPSALFIP